MELQLCQGRSPSHPALPEITHIVTLLDFSNSCQGMGSINISSVLSSFQSLEPSVIHFISLHITRDVAATSHLPFTTENYHSPCRAPVEPSTWNFPLKLGTHVKYKAYSDTLSFQCPSTLTSRIIKDLIESTLFPSLSIC